MLRSPFRICKPLQFGPKPSGCDSDLEAREEREARNESDPCKEGEDKSGQHVREIRLRRGIVAERKQGRRKRPGIFYPAILLALAFLIFWYIFIS